MMFARVVLGISGALVLVSGAQAQSSVQPSFSCNAANLEAEITICESRRLSRLDVRMAELYIAVREPLGWFKRRRFRRDQQNWLEKRNACDDNRRCLREAYEARIDVLSRLAGVDEGNENDYADREDGPSFNCNRARRGTEETICRSRRLSRLDRELDALYRNKLEIASTRRARRRLKRDQQDWVSNRNDCGTTRKCIRRAYEDRIAELGRKRRPAFQRTAEWRRDCDRNLHEAMRTACDSEVLWTLGRDVSRAYQDALKAAPRKRARRRLTNSQADWVEAVKSCGQREKCIRRKFSNRISTLRDQSREFARPAYQRTAEWRDTCRDLDNVALRTTCESKELWGLNRDMIRDYKDLVANTSRRRVRNRIKDDQQSWRKSWRSCDERVRCQRRAYRDRIAELRDYRSRPARSASVNYKRTAGWQSICPRIGHATGQTTCNNEQLWELYVIVRRTYDDMLASSRDAGFRYALQQDQAAWKRTWMPCGTNVKCQRRSFRTRISELEDPKYLRKLRRVGAAQLQNRKAKRRKREDNSR
ncbi:MAG: hypothetical protein ACR2O4_07260 [Hyphomicrobiaceae bacterium]